MLMNKLIAVDVDLTVVDPVPYWQHWLRKYGKLNVERFCSDEKIDYALYNYYDLPDGVDGMGFWRQTDLYGNLKCYDAAVETIRALYNQGNKIIFVSYCFSEHENSKIAMLRRDFPFLQGDDFVFVSTKHKGYVKCDIIIDDRLDMLNQFGDTTTKLLLDTPYTQTGVLTEDIISVKNWYEIWEVLNGEKFNGS